MPLKKAVNKPKTGAKTLDTQLPFLYVQSNLRWYLSKTLLRGPCPSPEGDHSKWESDKHVLYFED